jgi:GAF domain-containing protein
MTTRALRSAPVEGNRRRGDVEAELRAAPNIRELMRTAARLAAEAVGGSGCAISRVIGDVLIEMAEFSGTRDTLYLGHGYLISDYPLTREAIERREPRTVYTIDPDADSQEVALLNELGFSALLMLPICAADEVWGLAEVYREGVDRFVDSDAEQVTSLFELVGERVVEFERDR